MTNLAEQLNASLAGRYAIERELGQGGMATVYLAQDIKHKRKVALKVLKPELGAVLGVERFLSEIQVTANLQHPNLLPLFDSGESDGLLFYVMPFVDGESLRARLDREKQLPIDEAVGIAAALAGALEYAHQNGVIHRDMKPENVLLKAGQPLIADFGIALAVSNAGGARVTQTGLSLGTPQYMSPEQATGDRVIDGRTDIYSLGAVTYEMLTGEPPHTGTTAQAIIARLMTEKPRPMRAIRASVPDHVEGAVERALEKLPADRWGSAREFCDALTGARSVPTMGTTARGSRDRERVVRRLRVVAVAGWTAAVVAVAAAVVLSRPTRAADPVVARFGLLLPDSVGISNVVAGGRIAIAPNGSAIAVVGGPRTQSRLYVRAMSGTAFLPIAGTDSALNPSFSPDGAWLLYSNTRQLFKVPVGGGTPQIVADSAPTAFSSWGPGPDGELILFARRDGIYGVSPNGGSARRILGNDSSAFRFIRPVALPGGKVLLASRSSARTAVLDSARLVAVSIDGGKVKDLGLTGYAARYASGRIVFAQQGALLSAPFSLTKMAVTGPVERVADNVAQRAGGATDFAVADNGTLVTIGATDAGARDLYIMSRTGQRRPLAFPREAYFVARVTPDGRRAVVQIMPPGLGGGPARGDLWVYDLADGTRSRLTRDTSGVRGEWVHGSDTVVYIGRRGESPDSSNLIMSVAVNAGSSPIVLGGGRGFAEVYPGPHGGYWAVRRGAIGRGGDILIAHSDSLNNFRPFIATPAAEGDPRVSPNGRLLAFTSNETEESEVYVQPIPGPGRRVTVSVNGGHKPRWSSDGRTLYYQSGANESAGQFTAATIVESPTLAVTRREDLFAWSFTNIDPFPNDREFLVVDAPPIVRQEVSVIMNWPQLLKPRSDARQ